MMDNKICDSTKDGSICFQQLTAEYLDDAVNMMEYAFFRNENVCKATSISEDSKAIEELKQLLQIVARDGVTVIALDKSKNKVAGAAFNKIHVKPTEGENPFEIFAKTWKQPGSQAALKFIEDIENSCDLFAKCEVDCLFEIMFVGTLPEYRGRGLAKKLCEVSLEISRKLLNGVNVKVPIDGEALSLEPVPKAAFSIFTSFITQRIGKQLGFSVATERSFEVFEFNGRSFASVIGSHTPSVMLEYMKLE